MSISFKQYLPSYIPLYEETFTKSNFCRITSITLTLYNKWFKHTETYLKCCNPLMSANPHEFRSGEDTIHVFKCIAHTSEHNVVFDITSSQTNEFYDNVLPKYFTHSHKIHVLRYANSTLHLVSTSAIYTQTIIATIF